MRHIILVSYGVSVADYKRDFPSGDIQAALDSLSQKGYISFFPQKGPPSLVLITDIGYRVMPSQQKSDVRRPSV